MMARIEGYYEHFPPKGMNVSVKSITINPEGGQITKKNILIATKDIKEGEVIYTEEPVVTALDSDLGSTGTYCSHCLRKVDSGLSACWFDGPLKTAYCSKNCRDKASSQSHNVLFGLDPLVPDETPPTPTMVQERRNAQEKLAENILRGKSFSLLVARFVGAQVSAEFAKLGMRSFASSSAEFGDYTLNDHIERLRYLEIPLQREEAQFVSEVLRTGVPGLESMVTDERYAILKGKLAYNAMGVCFGEGRQDKPVSDVRPEDEEKTRTPYGTDHQIGCGLYQVSSYLAHSCSPTVRPSFPEGNSTIHLIANHALKKGDELTMAYVDVSQRPGETMDEARKRRRKELARGWRFSCTCQRCVDEAPQTTKVKEYVVGDESLVEDSVKRLDRGTSTPQ